MFRKESSSKAGGALYRLEDSGTRGVGGGVSNVSSSLAGNFFNFDFFRNVLWVVLGNVWNQIRLFIGLGGWGLSVVQVCSRACVKM